MSSSRRLARIAGVLYLVVAVFAAFSFNYATGTVHTGVRSPGVPDRRPVAVSGRLAITP